MATAMVQAGFRIPEETFHRYEQLAKRTGRTRSWYMNQALSGAIDRLEYEYGILQQVEDYRAGRLKTYTVEEVEERLGLAD